MQLLVLLLKLRKSMATVLFLLLAESHLGLQRVQLLLGRGEQLFLLRGLELFLFDFGGQSLHLRVSVTHSLRKLRQLIFLLLDGLSTLGHLLLEPLFESAHEGTEHGVAIGLHLELCLHFVHLFLHFLILLIALLNRLLAFSDFALQVPQTLTSVSGKFLRLCRLHSFFLYLVLRVAIY